MGTELVIGDRSADVRAIIPRTLGEVENFCEVLERAEVVPATYAGMPQAKRRGAMMVAIMKGLELGMPPLQALQNIYVVNGIPTLYGDALPAFVLRHGAITRIEEGWENEGADNESAVVTVWRNGEQMPPRRFSLRDAQAQGLLAKKGPWQHSRRRMMMIRARSYAFRDFAADALMGVGVKEEQEDILRSRGLDPDAILETVVRVDPLADDPPDMDMDAAPTTPPPADPGAELAAPELVAAEIAEGNVKAPEPAPRPAPAPVRYQGVVLDPAMPTHMPTKANATKAAWQNHAATLRGLILAAPAPGLKTNWYLMNIAPIREQSQKLADYVRESLPPEVKDAVK